MSFSSNLVSIQSKNFVNQSGAIRPLKCLYLLHEPLLVLSSLSILSYTKPSFGMNSSTIVVVGSTNTDMVIKASHLPQPGETILGGTFFMSAGGKGANQAVAAARLGGSVLFIAKTGYDIFAKQSIDLFEKEGIDIPGMQRDHYQPSGVALITVDDKGENCIVVAPGANAALTVEDINEVKEKIENASLLCKKHNSSKGNRTVKR